MTKIMKYISQYWINVFWQWHRSMLNINFHRSFFLGTGTLQKWTTKTSIQTPKYLWNLYQILGLDGLWIDKLALGSIMASTEYASSHYSNKWRPSSPILIGIAMSLGGFSSQNGVGLMYCLYMSHKVPHSILLISFRVIELIYLCRDWSSDMKQPYAIWFDSLHHLRTVYVS